MCNLYRTAKSSDEVAHWFKAQNLAAGANLGSEVYPGTPGLVLVDGTLQPMTWGFPLPQTSKKTGKPRKPKPVNNARTDKLDSFFWRYSFAERRCLIPLTAWAEAEGARGSMTRTWLSLPDSDLFACAGIWRESDEWGKCYSMVMTDSAGPAADVHTRMPVLLSPADYGCWTSGSPADAKALCNAWPDDLHIDRTDQPWARSRG